MHCMRENEDIAGIVYNTIEDIIFETHKFCTITDIMERTKKGRSLCEKALQDLLSQNKLYITYEGAGLPTIYVPKYMMNEMLLAQRKPEWLNEYSFKERENIDTKIRRLRNRLQRYEMFERLLYATGEPLEESVYFALKHLGIKKVKHHKKGDKDIQDIDFEINDTKFLVEVKGKTTLANKDDVEELMGWRKQEVLKRDNATAEDVKGILIVNHYRRTDPQERESVLTLHAKKWLKLYQLKVLTTFSLFELIKEVEKDILSKEKAIRSIIQGEQI